MVYNKFKNSQNTLTVGKEVRMKKLLVILTLFIISIFGIISIFRYGKTLDVNVEKGSKVPNFELKDFEAQKVKSRKFFNNGKPTLFIVAAEWCPDCQAELPEVQKFYDENKDKVNVVVVFISNKSSLLNVRKYVESNKYTFPVFYDFDKSIITGFKVKSVPFNLKIRNSVIEDISEGTMNFDGLNQMFMD